MRPPRVEYDPAFYTRLLDAQRVADCNARALIANVLNYGVLPSTRDTARYRELVAAEAEAAAAFDAHVAAVRGQDAA